MRLLPIILLLLWACDGPPEGRPWEGSVDTLPSGTIVTRNPADGTWDSSSAWRLTEELRLGSMEGGGPTMFGQIIALEVDAWGRIYVLERQAQEVRVFEPDGRFVRTIGRKGGGPGELNGANGLAFDPHGRLWVNDQGNSRYSVFDTAGTLRTTYRREARRFGYAWSGAISDGGDLWDSWSTVTPAGDGTAVYRFDSTAHYPDTLTLPPFEPAYFEFVRTSGGMRQMNRIGVAFAPQALWQFDPRGFLWWNRSDTYRILRLDLQGDTVRIVERAHERLPVTSDERRRIVEGLRGTFADFNASFDASKMPDHKPALRGFSVDDRGYLWVVPWSGVVFDVFDPDGRYLGRVDSEIEAWSRPHPFVRGSAMYYVVRDELDVPYVVRARIEGRTE